MNEVLISIGRGLAGLLRFGGRAGRDRFWHYAGFVLILTQLAALVAVLPTLRRIQSYAREHPEQARIESGPGHYSVSIQGNTPEIGSIMAEILGTVTIVAAVTVALLAAAVARRLHDCDRRGYWGLLPLPFLAAGLALMPRVFAGVASSRQPDLALFLGLFANNLLYLCALALLVYLLVGKGIPGPNRFGPPDD